MHLNYCDFPALKMFKNCYFALELPCLWHAIICWHHDFIYLGQIFKIIKHFIIVLNLDSLKFAWNCCFQLLMIFKADYFFSDPLFLHAGKVLVHCRQGRSRSAAIVAAFLMMRRGMTAAYALTMLRKSKFPNVRNWSFPKFASFTSYFLANVWVV